ncbi:MAG TPA: GNAT family N-acetyltransferase [Gaiellaceae bacterium]|nr:GNAT family N-acetyltransferase [Gaiellaceae bacterium]
MHAERIRAFQRDLAGRLADRREPSPLGEGLFVDELPSVYDLNYLLADRGDADELRTEVERLMERFHHRKAVAYHEVDLGWPQQVHLVMERTRNADRRIDTSHVRAVPFDRIAPARLLDSETPELNDAQRRLPEAIDTTWLAAFDGDALAAWCHVRTRDGIAQIEDVNTLEPFRGRGHGRAVVQHAIEHAGDGVVFLEALEDDWPRELYAKIGFDAVDRKTHHIRGQHPLVPLRIRTPRLELRLPTVAELRELYDVAEAGIHDPDVMVFEVPWTDDLNVPDFLAYHREQLELTTRDDLHVNFVAFLDGRPIGVQGINTQSAGRVVTGSWLGAACQRRGYGTEMRSAILSFAFDVLGADVAQSGAFLENASSRNVSRKLGYREIGSHFVSPRGEPLEHVDLELRREDFTPLVEAEITGYRW